jgi:hypothetical protein
MRNTRNYVGTLHSDKTRAKAAEEAAKSLKKAKERLTAAHKKLDRAEEEDSPRVEQLRAAAADRAKELSECEKKAGVNPFLVRDAEQLENAVSEVMAGKPKGYDAGAVRVLTPKATLRAFDAMRWVQVCAPVFFELLRQQLPGAELPAELEAVRKLTVAVRRVICHAVPSGADKMTELRDYVIDAVCEMERVLPRNEHALMLHRLLHLPDDVARWGPSSNFGCFGSERFMKVVRKCTHQSSNDKVTVVHVFQRASLARHPRVWPKLAQLEQRKRQQPAAAAAAAVEYELRVEHSRTSRCALKLGVAVDDACRALVLGDANAAGAAPLRLVTRCSVRGSTVATGLPVLARASNGEYVIGCISGLYYHETQPPAVYARALRAYKAGVGGDSFVVHTLGAASARVFRLECIVARLVTVSRGSSGAAAVDSADLGQRAALVALDDLAGVHRDIIREVVLDPS